MMSAIDFPYHRVVVVGTTASGKSTLAEKLAEKLCVDFIELDALHWEPNWKAAELEVFRRRVDAATQRAAWVVAGNYHAARDVIWPRAEAVIWLDYPLLVVFWRLLRRTVRRAVYREELWNGNREKFWWHLKLWSDKSLFKWLFKTYWRRKREYSLLFAESEHAHLQVIRLKSPGETDEWLAGIGSF